MEGLPQSRPLENDQSSVAISPTAAGGPGSLDPGGDLLPGTAPVELEEGLGVGRHDVFDRLGRERAQPDGGAPVGRRARDRHLGPGVDGLNPGRRHEDRERDRLSHDGDAEVPLLREPGHMGREAELAEGGQVVLVGEAALGAGQERFVDRWRKPLLGSALRLGHRLEPRPRHRAILPDPRLAQWVRSVAGGRPGVSPRRSSRRRARCARRAGRRSPSGPRRGCIPG